MPIFVKHSNNIVLVGRLRGGGYIHCNDGWTKEDFWVFFLMTGHMAGDKISSWVCVVSLRCLEIADDISTVTLIHIHCGRIVCSKHDI